MSTVWEKNWDSALGSKYLDGDIVYIMDIGGGDNALNCNQCDKIFSNKFSLKRHGKTHSSDKLFSCTQCDYKSSEKVP